MSKLAKKIAPNGPVATNRRPGRPGPLNLCYPLYGPGDLEDWEAVDSLRGTRDETGQLLDWRGVQRKVDALAGVTEPIDLERFRRHWRRRCDCWPRELKL